MYRPVLGSLRSEGPGKVRMYTIEGKVLKRYDVFSEVALGENKWKSRDGQNMRDTEKERVREREG
jgi:hypothetical protein